MARESTSNSKTWDKPALKAVWDDPTTGTKELIKRYPAPFAATSVPYDKAQLPTSRTGSLPPSVTIQGEDCLYVAEKLLKDPTAHGKVAVLDMANATYPGGGYKRGDDAQEEDLVRRTNFASALDQLGKSNGAAGFPQNAKNADVYRPGQFGAFDCLYAKDVTILKKGRNKQYDIISPPNQKQINIIASAAYDINQNHRGHVNKDANYATNTKKKIRQQFRTAVANGQNHLVLGAFGCGAFANDPTEMARFYKEVLQEKEFDGKFTKIVFAILPQGQKGQANYAAFNKEFSGPASTNKPHVGGKRSTTPVDKATIAAKTQALKVIFSGFTVNNDTTGNIVIENATSGKKFLMDVAANEITATKVDNDIQDYVKMIKAVVGPDGSGGPVYFKNASDEELKKMTDAFNIVQGQFPALTMMDQPPANTKTQKTVNKQPQQNDKKADLDDNRPSGRGNIPHKPNTHSNATSLNKSPENSTENTENTTGTGFSRRRGGSF